MVRTQIQLTANQHRALKRWAQQIGISLSEAVRRCVEERLARENPTPTYEQKVQAALSVCGKYRDPAGPSRVAQEHDRYLAEIYRK